MWITKIVTVAAVSFVLSAPAFADQAKQDKVEKKSFSIMKNIDEKKVKSATLDKKEMKQVKGGNVSLNIKQWKLGLFPSAKAAVFAFLGK